MAETLTKAQIMEHRRNGSVVEYDDDDDSGRRSIDGFDALVAEIRSLVEAQRASAGADMDRSEVQTQLIQAIQKLASRAPSGEMSQTVLEDLLVQLAERPDSKEPNPVYVFEFERYPSGYISKVIAKPQAS